MVSRVILNFILVIDLFSHEEWCFLSITHRKRFRAWFSQMSLIKAWLSAQILFTVSYNTQKVRGNDRKPTHTAWLMNPQFQYFAIPSTLISHPTTSKYYHPCYDFLSPQFRIIGNIHTWIKKNNANILFPCKWFKNV